MISLKSYLFLTAPYGEAVECVSSPRYHWDNRHRGKDPFVILQWTLEGEGVFRAAGKSHLIPVGKAFIAIPPENTQYHYPKDASVPWRFAWLNFEGPLAISLFRQLREEFGPALSLPCNSAAGAMALNLAETARARSGPDPYDNSVAAYAFFAEWLRELNQPAPEDSDPVHAAQTLCAARFREPLGIKELAAHTGLSREHFTRVFTERTGISPARHLRNLRVAAARQMMLRTATPLKEVALRCGFPSVRSLRQALGKSVH